MGRFLYKTAVYGALALLLSLCAGRAAAQSADDRQPTIVYINGAKYYVHTVAAGETLYSISRAYGADIDTVLKNNPAAMDALRPDMTLKIPVPDAPASKADNSKKRRKDYEFYTVKAGDTLYSISRAYGISIDTVLEDNPDVDPSQLSVDTRLYLRKSAMGTLQSAEVHEEWQNYRDNMNAVAPDGFFYYIVQPGDTLYSLSRRYGITEQEIVARNDMADGLKAGSLVMLPLPEGQSAVDETVHEYDAEVEQQKAAEAEEEWRHGYGSADGFSAVDTSRPVRVALLLPMTKNGGAVNSHYLDFYRGFLLGAEDVKSLGYSMDITLFDTEQSVSHTREIIENQLDDLRPDLIVGPVYENELAPVTEYAERHNVPVVSPLASLSSTVSPVVFQMSPDGSRKYDKAAELFDGSREVTLVYGTNVDKDFEREVLAMLNGQRYGTHKYVYEHQSVADARLRNSSGSGPSGPTDFSYLMRGGKNSVIVVLSDNETEVDRILAAIASADIALRTRERTYGKYVVFGSSKWQRYSNLDPSVFFNDKVVLLSSYSARRDDDKVRNFGDRHIADFGALPSLYTYRGYDAAMIFGTGMFGDIRNSLAGKRFKPLQTSYTFERADDGRIVNTEWMRIDYRDDFSIKVE